jgi:hypothetical protein
MLKHMSDKVGGLIVSCIALAYFIKLYSATHRFSYGRLCYVLLLTMILFSPVIVFVAVNTSNESALDTCSWGGIAVALLMCGAVGAIFSLGLGCCKRKGAISTFASKVLQCHIRDEDKDSP